MIFQLEPIQQRKSEFDIEVDDFQISQTFSNNKFAF